MTKSKLLLVLLSTLVAAAIVIGVCRRPTARLPELTGGDITIDTLLPLTPVKSQGKSPLCWVYAMLATIETDRLAQGDSVNLSPAYVARCFLAQQARRYYQSQGKSAMSLRGMMTMTLKVLEENGVQPYDYYRKAGKADWNVLLRKVRQLADEGLSRREELGRFEQKMGELLDAQTDFMPRYVHMLGAEYTSEEFGRSVVMPGDWLALTSFTHHPFGESFALELPDNQFHDSYLNVPLDTLVEAVRRSLLAGHAVCWEGDISERGFSFEKGFAEVEETRSSVAEGTSEDAAQKLRQRQFERRQTTDDHCMALIGLAHDGSGRRYYVAKNSWGTGNPFGGLMYLSEDYLRMKTIAVAIRSDLVKN